jgi:hypothetical protein
MKNKLSFFSRFPVILGTPFFFFILIFMFFSFVFAEDWMPFEDFLQHCPAKHRSYRSDHWERGTMHRMLDGNCGFAKNGKIAPDVT